MSEQLPSAAMPPPRSPIDDLPLGVLPPDDLDPLADGILMAHQVEWVSDESDLKLAEKGRRTGITFAEALASTLIGAASAAAGGDNTFYIGDTKEKGLEFIGTCAKFARNVAAELLSVEDFLFDDVQEDGSSRQIQAYRIRFASGFQICALSSRPANIRGLQGRVIIDEAAFHPNVRGVIDACNALLIWGGKIRIISTHNGTLNAFNELIKETREGLYDYSIHRITFDDAVANGLYERVCLLRNWTASAEGKAEWYRKVRRSYGTRIDAMREELDAVPREGEGVMLPLAWIEACSTRDYKVVRWEPPTTDFVDQSEEIRRTAMRLWLEEHVAPHLVALAALQTAIGEDFAMRQDRTCIAIGYTASDLIRHVPLIVELRSCPYDQQKQALFYIAEQLRDLRAAILDANGNGMVLAQETRQKFGQHRVVELMANDAWYRENSPRFRAAFEDRTILLPADLDVRDDLRQFRMVGGVGKIPRDIRNDGSDGGRRHGDAGVALLNFYTATMQEIPPPAGATIEAAQDTYATQAEAERPTARLLPRNHTPLFGRRMQ
jgi:phage FluMu gp28-like protein